MPALSPKTVTLIIPCYNESASLPFLYEALQRHAEQLPQYAWEFLFINDGSEDDTLAQIKRYAATDRRISFLDLSRNFGKEHAMLAGFDHARGDCAVMLDADLQDPPSLIAEMLQYWEQGYEDVYARRRERGEESWLRRKSSLLFYRLLNKSTRFDLLENVGDFRLLDRKCLQALRQLRESERYTKGLYCWIGFKKKEILFDRGSRQHGKTHWNFWQLAGLAFNGFIGFTTFPLRIATIVGSLVALWALGFFLWVLIKASVWGDPVAGYPTLISVVLFLGAVQLICIGILGEYVGRIFTQTKERPVYLVREYFSHPDQPDSDERKD